MPQIAAKAEDVTDERCGLEVLDILYIRFRRPECFKVTVYAKEEPKRLLRATLESVASGLGIRPNVTHIYFSFKVKKMEEFMASHFFGRGNN
jgi:hypothetical protein